MKLKKLAISCGGTGGHFFPGLSVARTMVKQGNDALLLLSGINSASQKEIAEKNGIKAIVLPEMPSPGTPAKALRFSKGLALGLLQTRTELRKFAPQAVLGMGSFASLPVLFGAIGCSIPCFLHDGNARIGRANRFLSRFARFLGTAFPPVNANACHGRVECVGMPLRPELLESRKLSKPEAMREIAVRHGVDFDPSCRTLLIFGGSQGAGIFNQVFPAALHAFAANELQVIHLSGPKKLEETRAAYRDCPLKTLVLPGTSEMAMFYQASDLVAARSGGSTVAELLLFGKPSILIPYPYAAEDHQYDNAMVPGKANAALVMRNNECSADRIIRELRVLFGTPGKLEAMGTTAAEFGKPDASEILLERISERIS